MVNDNIMVFFYGVIGLMIIIFYIFILINRKAKSDNRADELYDYAKENNLIFTDSMEQPNVSFKIFKKGFNSSLSNNIIFNKNKREWNIFDYRIDYFDRYSTTELFSIAMTDTNFQDFYYKNNGIYVKLTEIKKQYIDKWFRKNKPELDIECKNGKIIFYNKYRLEKLEEYPIFLNDVEKIMNVIDGIPQ